LSPITKVLVVLVSLGSIFLCTAVVMYVGNTQNYKALYEQEQDLNKSIVADSASIRRLSNEKAADFKLREKQLNDRIELLESEKNELAVTLRGAERTSLDYEGRVNTFSGLFASFEQTIGNLEGSLKLTQQQLDMTRAESIKNSKELNEIQDKLYELIVQLQTVEAEKRQLLEEKESLQKLLKGQAETTTAIGVVTPHTGSARPAVAVATHGSIKGLIDEVSESLVTLSIGSADGVSKGMIFYVTRGDEFVCEVNVTDVDVNMAAGTIGLVRQQPRIGDNVGTQL